MPSAEDEPAPLPRSWRGAVGLASRPGWPAATVAIVGVGAQIVAFLYGFQATRAADPSTGWARVWALVGLAAALVVLTVVAGLVDRGWLPSRSALVFLALGAFAGGVVAFYLPSSMVGAAGELFVYTSVVLLYGTLVVGLLLVAAGIAYIDGRRWWRPLVTAPALLHTGAHAVILVGLLVQAGDLAAALAPIPLPGW